MSGPRCEGAVVLTGAVGALWSAGGGGAVRAAAVLGRVAVGLVLGGGGEGGGRVLTCREGSNAEVDGSSHRCREFINSGCFKCLSGSDQYLKDVLFAPLPSLLINLSVFWSTDL